MLPSPCPLLENATVSFPWRGNPELPLSRLAAEIGRDSPDACMPRTRTQARCVVSSELYTERGSVPRRTGTDKQDYISQAAVERTSDKQRNKQAGLTRPAHVPVHTARRLSLSLYSPPPNKSPHSLSWDRLSCERVRCVHVLFGEPVCVPVPV